MVQIGGIISANIYVTSDAPLYHKGNTSLIIINIIVLHLFLLTKAYYIMRNRIRDKKWNAMTTEVKTAIHVFLSPHNFSCIRATHTHRHIHRNFS